MRVNNKKKVTGTDRKRKKKIPNIDKTSHLDVFDQYDAIFSFLISESKKNKLSDGADSIMISALAKEIVLYHKCMKDVESRGAVIKFKNGTQDMEQINPCYKAAKIAIDNIKSICKECGFTAKSRVLMSSHLIDGENEPDDPLANEIPGMA